MVAVPWAQHKARPGPRAAARRGPCIRAGREFDEEGKKEGGGEKEEGKVVD